MPLLPTHSEAWDMLQRARQRNRLPHTLLFVGPQGVGKQAFALRFIQSLVCHQPHQTTAEPCGECAACHQVEIETHPDLHIIRLPEGKHELPIDLFIGASDRRGKEGLCHDLNLSPLSSAYRIGLICDSLALNEASANSLLKTLEEPPAHSLILLLCDDIEQILPTIRSRCQTIWFMPLEIEQVAQIGKLHGWSDNPDVIAPLCERFQGNLDLICNALQQEKVDPITTAPFSQFPFPVASVQALVEEGLKNVSGTSAQREIAQQWLNVGVRIWKAALNSLTQNQTSVDPQVKGLLNQLDTRNENAELLIAMIEKIWAAEHLLQRHLNASLVLCSFADEIGWLQRQMVRSR